MRTELALYDYGFESVAYHLLHERYPKHDHQTLTNWFDPPTHSSKGNYQGCRFDLIFWDKDKLRTATGCYPSL